MSHPSIVTIYEIDQAGSAEPFSVGLRQTITGTDRIRCAWTSNSRQLVCADVTGGLSQLVRRTVPPSTEALPPLAAAGTSAGLPTIARQSSRLTYVNYSQDSNLWRADLKDSITPGPLISSPRQDTQPDYSADGRKIAFISGRSGVNEVWTADADGSNAAQVTTQGAIPTAPRWSPDGRSIAFAKRPGGPEHGRRYRAVCEDRLATRILHYDLSWNPTRHEQREGRVNRYGQPSPKVRVVTYYREDLEWTASSFGSFSESTNDPQFAGNISSCAGK